MASIQKLKNGSYKATIYVGRDENGKMLREYMTFPSWTECNKAAKKRELDIEENNLSNLGLMKMDKYMDKWLEVNKPMLASTTVKAYKIYIEKHFKPHFKKYKVNQVTEMMIKEYIAKKLETLSSTTVRKHFFTLSKMFYDALKIKSPCIDVKAPKNAEFKPCIPTEDEFKQIYEVFKQEGIEEEACILLAGWCGMRRGEIFALKWDDIDYENGTIRVDEALALEEDSYDFDFKDPKSHNGIRVIAAPDYLLDLLNEIKKQRPKNTRSKRKTKIDKPKDNSKNKKQQTDISHEIFSFNPHSFTKKYSRVIAEKKLPKVRFHDLRHYHASLLYKNNVPDLYAAERLGHDIWVLKKIYQHLGLNEKKELDQKVKDIFK